MSEREARLRGAVLACARPPGLGEEECVEGVRHGHETGAARLGRAAAATAGVALALAAGLSGAVPAAAQETSVAGDWEQTATLRASELLPPELLKGPHHEVDESVATDGLARIFTISSEFGRFEARGEAELRQRIREIEAIAALRAAGGSESVEPDAGPAPSGPTMVGGIAVGEVLGTPPGADPSAAPGMLMASPAFADLDAIKRLVAHELGIDPHTENPELQQELQRHAWATLVGGRTSPFVRNETPAAPPTEEPTPPGDRSSELLRDFSAEDLERLNRLELMAMGVDETLREEFLAHPSYSPAAGTRLVEALSALEETADRDAFIAAALEAQSSEEAQGFQRMAELLRAYHAEVGTVERFLTVGGRVAASADDGTLLVPVDADHALWTPHMAAFTESIASAMGAEAGVTKTRFLVSGSLSARARDEVTRRGIDVTEGADASEAAADEKPTGAEPGTSAD